MTEIQFNALLPYTLLAGSSMVIILLIAFRLSHTVIQVAGFLLLCIVITALISVKPTLPVSIPPLFHLDGFALLFTAMIIFCVLVIGLFSYIYFEEREENPKEYYILLFLGTLGAAILTISNHFISLFIGLELLSVSLYALIAYLRTRNNAVEAGMKYLVLAAVSSAFLLFGMALIYMEAGSMEFITIAQQIRTGSSTSVLLVLGAGFMIVAIGFKLALVPFHLWAADVYQGAPTPVTLFIATVSKIGVFAVLVRFALAIELGRYIQAGTVFTVLAIASMVAGNILALRQQNIKRLLAYSSIAHFGYLLVAFLTGGGAGVEAGVFYLLSYSVTLLSAFGVITLLSTRKQDAEDLSLYRGLFRKDPLMAAVLAIALFSLAGIPLTAGFPAKFFVITTGVRHDLWPAVIALVLTSVIGLYYYLRVISTIFEVSPSPETKERTLHPFFYTTTYITLAILMVLVCVLGIFPEAFVSNIRDYLLIR
ncbi:MAG: NADH-quinone oxidoreductase subunit N [Chitinophagaceae bacterium]|nr:MAG: NADH-quinone oxidoreductase subunit N [Chitinophagaceae bacterium]